MTKTKKTNPKMKLAIPLLLACALLPGASLAAQELRTVRGRVLTAEGVPLAGAVVAEAGHGARSVAGAGGDFRIRLRGERVALVAAHIGFAPDTVTVGPGESAVTFRLRPAPYAIEPLTVTGERSFSAASSGTIRELDVRLRPRESSQELLRLAPGLVIAQHGGGGKPEQIFLRGFDADHGTDVAVSVDGTPVNIVSHGHGQGYADLHFLLPEVVQGADVRKGPFAPRDGDFATAGAVAFRTLDRLPHGVAGARVGSFGSRRLLAMAPFGGDATESGGYLAVAGHLSQGPFESPDDYRRVNAFGKWTAPLRSGAEAFASASAYAGGWNASGQVPERAVREGRIGRFGAIDPSEGGTTGRYEASLGVRSGTRDGGEWEARVYAVRYHLQLFSNFTFFLADSVRGDGIEQVDDRYLAGLHATYARPSSLFGRTAYWRAGLGSRMDRAEIALHHQEERRRLAPRVDNRIAQESASAWGSYDVDLSDRAHLQLGLRGDLFRFGLHDRLEDRPGELPRGSGVRWRGIVSPRANLAVRLSESAVLFTNVGSGFHSNHARDVVLAGRADEVLPRAVGAEVGSRYTWRGGSVAAALWATDLESELVYVPDEGITEPSGRTRRAGADLEARVQLLPWLWADADLNLSRGRFRDEPAGADRIPLAPTVASTGGLTVRELGAMGGGLRYRHVGSRPADETASVTAHGHTLWELFASWELSRASVVLAVDNLFDAAWNDAQFATTSRLPGEPAGGITELHFTPGAPRAVHLGVEYRF